MLSAGVSFVNLVDLIPNHLDSLRFSSSDTFFYTSLNHEIPWDFAGVKCDR